MSLTDSLNELLANKKYVPDATGYNFVFKSALLTVRVVQNYSLVAAYLMSTRQLAYNMNEVLALLIWTEFYKKLPCRLIIGLKKLYQDDLPAFKGNVPHWPPLLAEPHIVQYATNILFMRQNFSKYRPLEESDYRVIIVES